MCVHVCARVYTADTVMNELLIHGFQEKKSIRKYQLVTSYILRNTADTGSSFTVKFICVLGKFFSVILIIKRTRCTNFSNLFLE